MRKHGIIEELLRKLHEGDLSQTEIEELEKYIKSANDNNAQLAEYLSDCWQQSSYYTEEIDSTPILKQIYRRIPGISEGRQQKYRMVNGSQKSIRFIAKKMTVYVKAGILSFCSFFNKK